MQRGNDECFTFFTSIITDHDYRTISLHDEKQGRCKVVTKKMKMSHELINIDCSTRIIKIYRIMPVFGSYTEDIIDMTKSLWM